MNLKLIVLPTLGLLASCASIDAQRSEFTDVYVADFGSDDMEHCRSSDVDLNHAEAKEFFVRARQVDYQVIHDHYNYAPCYIEGTLKHNRMVCDWEIRAGATGQIRCGDEVKYFVCDTCDDLFKSN